MKRDHPRVVSAFGALHNSCVLVQDENLFLAAARFQFFAEGPKVSPGATPVRRKYGERVMHIRFELLAATADTLNGGLTYGASTKMPYQHVPEKLFVHIRADGIFFAVLSNEQAGKKDREG